MCCCSSWSHSPFVRVMPLPCMLYVCTNNYALTTIIRMPPSRAVVPLGLIRHLFVWCPCLVCCMYAPTTKHQLSFICCPHHVLLFLLVSFTICSCNALALCAVCMHQQLSINYHSYAAPIMCCCSSWSHSPFVRLMPLPCVLYVCTNN